jgi:hypothetical protein
LGEFFNSAMNKWNVRWGLLLMGTLMLQMAASGWAANGQIKIGQRDFPLTITNSGSFILTESVTNGSGMAIQVQANYVTLDLNGYTMKGNRSSFSTGIGTFEGVCGLYVRNGHLEDFGRYAVGLGDFGRMERVAISGCGQAVSAGEGSLIIDCQVYSNSTADIGDPINLDSGSILQDFLYEDNVSQQPFDAVVDGADACLLSRVQVARVSTTGTCWVVQGGSGSLVSECVVADCDTRASTMIGIRVLDGALVADSAVRDIAVVNGSAYGLSGTVGSMFLRCQVEAITSSVSSAKGVYGLYGTCVSDCRISDVAGTGLSFDTMGRIVRTTSSDHSGLGYEAIRSGVVLRENHAAHTLNYGYQIRGFTSLLLLNTAFRAGSGFSDFPGQTNHRAQVVSSPGMFYELRSNSWANVRY